MHARAPIAALASASLALILVGCSAAGSPGSGSGGPGPTGGASAPDVPVPSTGVPGDDPVSGTPAGGSGGASGEPQGTLVFPKAGVIDPQPVPVQAMRQHPSDSHVVVRLDWTSGVEPCSTLAGVRVAREGDTFTLTVLEGSTDRDVACIEIAQLKTTLVDLGELPTGTYTVIARPGLAPPLTVVVE